MSLEIRELVIKAVVSSGSSGHRTRSGKNSKASKKIIAKGLEEITQIIQDKNER